MGDFDDAEWKKRLGSELGDCLWFIAMLADVAGMSLDDVAQNNIKKLRARLEKDVIRGDGEDRTRPT